MPRTMCAFSAPTANVTLTPSAAEDSWRPFAPLTFFTSSWALPEFVTVGAVDDAVVEPPPQLATIAHAVASADPAYAGAMPARSRPRSTTMASPTWSCTYSAPRRW
ncbi:MAG: hypothetical protein IPG75_16905 [Gemmatimonadetes bacterium]|nr:hypothetical protein [Gemmatimonadota bacterium]